MEAIFLVDCSGSMDGISMDLAKESLQVFIHSLPLNSFFNIFLFGTTYESMFPESKKYDDDSLQGAKEFVHTIFADLGGDNNDIEAEKQVENDADVTFKLVLANQNTILCKQVRMNYNSLRKFLQLKSWGRKILPMNRYIVIPLKSVRRGKVLSMHNPPH